MVQLYAETIATGSPTLVLLHGLGVNGAVWAPMVAALTDWPGRIVIPDFRGHGRSPHGAPYGLGQHAADVAALVGSGEPIAILGHSMGGMVGLVLASGWFGVAVEKVLGFGLKVTWRPDELLKLRQIAATPTRWFDTRAEAVERFLRVAGLAGAAEADAPVVAAGIVEEKSRYRLAGDPATVLVAGPSMDAVLGAVQSRWRLACGSSDPLVTVAELRAYDAQAIEIAGCGHNPHVEVPAVLAQLLNAL